MSDLEALADGAYNTFGAAIEQGFASPENGSIPQVYREWQAVRAAKATLSAVSSQVADGIEAIMSDPDPRLTQDVRAAIVAQNMDLYTVAESQAVREIQAGLARIKTGLQDAYASKVVEAPSADRALIRQEIEQTIQATRGTRTAALRSLVESNPERYGAEVASAYGANLLKLNGEGEFHGAIATHARNLIPDTPKSARASAVLGVMQASRIEGMLSAITHPARQRVEAAKAPKASDRRAYIPDTIIPRR